MIYYEPEQPILKQGETNVKIYYMLLGLSEVCGWAFPAQKAEQEDEAANTRKIRELHPGQYFGEVSFLYNTVTSAAVKATNYTSVGYLEKEKVEELFDT
jgi:CRP-like cAMP-binding protein